MKKTLKKDEATSNLSLKYLNPGRRVAIRQKCQSMTNGQRLRFLMLSTSLTNQLF